MSGNATKNWVRIHKWTSLLSTLSLLVLCITGLPLIFSDELTRLSAPVYQPATLAEGQAPMPLDTVVALARAEYPDHVPLFVGWDDPGVPLVYVNVGPRPDASPEEMRTIVVDVNSGRKIDAPQFNEGPLYFILRLHSDLFLGQNATLFIGAMAIVFVLSLVSGIVIYGPFMRKLAFGSVRRNGSTRIKWLDLHNALGIITVLWATVMGLTGFLNAYGTLMEAKWEADTVAVFAEKYQGQPRPTRFASLDHAVATAHAVTTDMVPSFISFPGTGYSGDHHYGVFMQSTKPWSAGLTQPVLVDAASGALGIKPAIPGYITAFELSQPLHFGDYGGLPLKIIWALLDLVTIIVLLSGIYLWVKRAVRKSADPDAIPVGQV